ncbi:hypothetical protein Tco_1552877, partial [Tanacetum coccineum]
RIMIPKIIKIMIPKIMKIMMKLKMMACRSLDEAQDYTEDYEDYDEAQDDGM